MKFRLFSVIALAVVGLLNIAPVAAAVVQVDMSETVKNNSMLLLLLFSLFTILAGLVLKLAYDRLDRRMTKTAEDNNNIGGKLREAEANQLKFQNQILTDKVSRLEAECHACQKILPSQYVTKQEFDKFVDTHREDINNITHRLENLMRDLKSEIRADMEIQIERILAILKDRA